MTEETQYVKNFGIATPKVYLHQTAPNIKTKTTRLSFDISAESFPSLSNSPFFPPLLVEPVIVENEFSVLYPSKRKYYIDNFMVLDAGLDPVIDNFLSANDKNTTPIITWHPCDYTTATPNEIANKQEITTKKKIPKKSILFELFKNFNQIHWKQTPSSSEKYIGPVWQDITTEWPPPPEDVLAVKDFFEWAGITEPTADPILEKPAKRLNVVSQCTAYSGLLWGAESNGFLLENTPFWINIKKEKSTIVKKEFPTYIVISLGLTSNTHRYDLILNMDSKPQLIDYYLSEDAPYISKEWDVDLSRINKEEKNIEIGIMVAGGRLIIHINKIPLVYTRVSTSKDDKNSKIKLAAIAKGPIRIYGTNIKIDGLHACAMNYAHVSMMALPIPNVNQLGGKDANGKPKKVDWKGVDNSGNILPTNTVAELPRDPSQIKPLYGVDCRRFEDETGAIANPKGDAFLESGSIYFKDSKEYDFEMLGDAGFYVLTMLPDSGAIISAATNTPIVIKNSRCPYFFRLKGAAAQEYIHVNDNPTDLTNYVLSISETASAPDYFQVKKNATITFYNESGVVSNLIDKQKAISISWGWNIPDNDEYGTVDAPTSAQQTTFTGVVTDIVKGEQPGNETLTVTCSDYFHILEQTPIINSPFYDGMVGSAAIKDLAERAGCVNPIIDWSGTKIYFLPSGFAYTKPAVKFGSKDKLLECILKLAKRFEAYFYFDGNGRFVLTKLPGGLFSVPTKYSAKFYQDPKTEEDVGIIMLGEKNITIDYGSTFNTISILTLERDTRNAIIHTHSAKEADDKLVFKKILLIDEPAYGELEVARGYALQLGERIFKPILKTGVKMAGNKFIMPLDFVKILNHPFRVMSFKRSYSAETNDFSQEIECEWLGG